LDNAQVRRIPQQWDRHGLWWARRDLNPRPPAPKAYADACLQHPSPTRPRALHMRVVSEGRTVISPSELFVNISLADCSRLQHLAKQSKPRILEHFFMATIDVIWSLPDPFSYRLDSLWRFPKIVVTARLPDGPLLSVALCVTWAFSQLCSGSIRLTTWVAMFV